MRDKTPKNGRVLRLFLRTASEWITIPLFIQEEERDGIPMEANKKTERCFIMLFLEIQEEKGRCHTTENGNVKSVITLFLYTRRALNSIEYKSVTNVTNTDYTLFVYQIYIK